MTYINHQEVNGRCQDQPSFGVYDKKTLTEPL